MMMSLSINKVASVILAITVISLVACAPSSKGKLGNQMETYFKSEIEFLRRIANGVGEIVILLQRHIRSNLFAV